MDRFRCRWNPLQQPRLFCPWGNWIGRSAGRRWESSSSRQWERGCTGEGQSQKTSVQRTVAPATIVIGIPTTTPFHPLSNVIATFFHSGVTIPSVPRKKQAIALDTSATSSERSITLSLIEDVDMEELIVDLMKTKVSPSAYRRIQEFLNKVCVPFYYFIHSLYEIEYLFFILFSMHFFSSWSGPYSSRHQA